MTGPQESEVDQRLAAYGAEMRKWVVRSAIAFAVALAALAVLIVVLSDDSGESGVQGEKAKPGDYPGGAVIPAPGLGLADAAKKARCRVVHPPKEGDDHVGSKVRYRANPPTSGDHNPTPADDGAYVRAPATEATVHSLEHGRVLIQFRPDASKRLRGQLFALFKEDKYHLLLAPNTTGMRWQVAATAWNHALLCKEMNDKVFDAIRVFRDRYRDRSPELFP
jgi:uncharacterized protein DUF3105